MAAGRLSRPACTGASLLTPALVCDEVTNLPNAAQSLRGKGPPAEAERLLGDAAPGTRTRFAA